LAKASEATFVPTVEHRRGGRFRGARFKVNVEFFQDPLGLGIGEDVHQMRDRRALVAADVGNTGLQQGLGDGEDPLTVEIVAFAQAQLFDFFGE